MTDRNQRAKIAHETVEILNRGYYETESGSRIDIESDLEFARENTVLYKPEDFKDIQLKGEDPEDTRLEVTNETTLQAAESLKAPGSADPFVLNFASARNPGGGFLNGSGAQEESLARATGLYACISEVTEYYQKNRQSGTGLYTNNMIYSPKVPVIRDDDGDLLESPFKVTILTAPAVNRRVVEKNEPERLSEVRPTMDDRIKKVLKVATDNGHRKLVLGAWGCGVFDNDPAMVSKLFKKHLWGEMTFKGGFREVLFAVLDRTPDKKVFQTFKNTLKEK